MPTYITDCRIDWGWAARTDEERQIIKTYQPRLDDRDHTAATFAELFARASAELPAVPIAALVDEESGSRTLFLAAAGTVTVVLVKDATRRRSITLGQHDQVRALLAADKSALFPVTVSALDRLAAGDTTLSCGLFFPEPVLALVQAEATRLDRSLSSIVQLAWTDARAQIQALADRDAAASLRAPHASAAATHVKQTLFLPTTMVADMEVEAARFESSLSWLVQLAVAIAFPGRSTPRLS